MPDIWLVLDANNMCWRSYYAMGSLSSNGEQTGIAYGFLRDMLGLSDRFSTRNFAICFDKGVSLRRRDDGEYKANRKPSGDDSVNIVRDQIARLRDELLPKAGFSNVLVADGYEADDCDQVLDREPESEAEGLVPDQEREGDGPAESEAGHAALSRHAHFQPQAGQRDQGLLEGLAGEAGHQDDPGLRYHLMGGVMEDQEAVLATCCECGEDVPSDELCRVCWTCDCCWCSCREIGGEG